MLRTVIDSYSIKIALYPQVNKTTHLPILIIPQEHIHITYNLAAKKL